ncbi:MAG: hypothetical protein DRZ82_09000 [Thermoprotei archaeon]|nr:MAG: hypothetical protein DRZ82_09000 [Thermoprotei archaeon]
MSDMPIRFGYILEKGINNLFYCWVREVTDKGERFRIDEPSKYWIISWDERKYTEFSKARFIRPKGLTTVSLRSRNVFKYGVFQLNARLPKWENGPMLWFGFEAEDLFGGGVVHFLLHNGKLYAFAGAWGGDLLKLSLITPEDYYLRRHVYSIYVHETVALWFIDMRLSALAILTNATKPYVVHEGHPYSIGITSMRPSTALGILMDIDGGPTDREWVWDDIHPWQIRVLNGSPRASLMLDLYHIGSKRLFRGEIRSKQAISHPLPSLGLRTTILFKSRSSGKLAIQTYTRTSSWETLDEFTVQRNKLTSYTVEKDVPLVRLVYEPKDVPTVIEVAEAVIN